MLVASAAFPRLARAAAALALLGGLLAVLAPVRAAEVMSSFEAEYEVRPDGTVAVTELIAWDFAGEPDRHGIIRDLIMQAKCGQPLEGAEQPLYPCPGGSRRTWPISDVRVEGAPEGQALAPVPFTSSRVGDALELKIGDADVVVSGVWHYRITYVIEAALDAYEDHDEFYWNATGVSPVTILGVSITVRLPEGAQGRGRCLQGGYSPDEECEVEVSGGGAVIVFRSNGWVGANDQVTIVAGWQKGLVEVQPPRIEDLPSIDDYFTFDAFEFAGTAAAAVVGFAGVAGLWWRHGRDRRYRSVYYLTQDPREERRPLFGPDNVVVEFVPPEGLKPAQMGVILDERADPLDVTATIIDLAVNGYLHISEIEKSGLLGGMFAKDDWLLTRKRTDPAGLLPYEREIMAGLFATGSEVKLSDLKNRFYKYLDDAQDKLYEDALAKGWFPRHPRTTKAIWAGAGILLAIVGAGLTFLAGFELSRATMGIPLVLAGLTLAALAPAMPRRTAAGSEALRRVLGFRLYVSTAEKYQHEFNEQQNIFARYLPYAIVFGCVSKWAKAFESLDDRVAQETAAWYTGAGAFHVASFSNRLQGLSSNVTSTVRSTPSSSGSGFSGGGRAGGGGGGGGTRSW